MKAKKQGFEELKADLKKAQRQAPTEAQRVVKRGAQNIKKDAADHARGFSHLPHIHRAIGYDLTKRRGFTAADVGFDKSKRQGPLGNVIEYGTVNNAPQPVLSPALDREFPRLEEQVERMGRELLE